MIWFIAYTCTWNATQATLLSELPAHPAREASLAMAQMCNGAVSAVVVVVSAYLQNPTDANLGAKIGYICKQHFDTWQYGGFHLRFPSTSSRWSDVCCLGRVPVVLSAGM